MKISFELRNISFYKDAAWIITTVWFYSVHNSTDDKGAVREKLRYRPNSQKLKYMCVCVYIYIYINLLANKLHDSIAYHLTWKSDSCSACQEIPCDPKVHYCVHKRQRYSTVSRTHFDATLLSTLVSPVSASVKQTSALHYLSWPHCEQDYTSRRYQRFDMSASQVLMIVRAPLLYALESTVAFLTTPHQQIEYTGLHDFRNSAP
jgi:hypothetical protein